jgi:hypothetical protein
MDPIAQLKTRLEEYPSVRYRESQNSLEVEPVDDSGFSVGLQVSDGRFTVFFDSWHEEFDSAEEALNCLAFGLSESCRLAVEYRGTAPVKWIVEYRKDGSWVADSATGLLFSPFWRIRRVVHKQNHLIPAP